MKYLYLSGAVVFFALGSGVLVFGMPGSDALGSDDEIEVEEQETIPASTGEAVGSSSAVVQTSPTPTPATTQTMQTIATTKCYGDGDPDEDDWEGDDEDDKQNCVTEYITVPVGTSGSSGATGTGSVIPSPAPTPTPTPTTGGGTVPSTPETSGYTLAAVAQHNTSASCWSVVDGKVYNLTNWISQHPGGQAEIKAMCGVDASAAFAGQHAGARKPAQELAAFFLGNLTQ